MTSVELLSSVGRLVRTADGLEDLAMALRADVLQLTRRVSAIADGDGVRRRAERLVGVHPLSAGGAMQLAAALVACGDRPELLPFVTLDRPLARCAQLVRRGAAGVKGNRESIPARHCGIDSRFLFQNSFTVTSVPASTTSVCAGISM